MNEPGERLAGLSRQGVVVVVGNYKCYSWIYEVICASACTRSFATHVETMSPPVTGYPVEVV